MGIILKTNGEAVVENKNTTPVVQQVQEVPAAEKTETPAVQATKPATTETGTEAVKVPENVTAGFDYKTVQQGLSTMYEGKYDDQLADLYNQIVQRKPFQYSTEDDMLFKLYEQKYTQQGKQAMRDSMGQAAALTGGYGSSYGQAVGQQNYDAYLKQITDLIPELEAAAYRRYEAEGDKLTQQYGLLSDMDSRDYSRWQGQYNVYGDAYKRLMDEAALRGAAGDFSKYREYFGDEAADKMVQLFNAQTLMPLWQSGQIDAEMYKSLTGSYPVGYDPNAGIIETEDGVRATSDILREQLYEGVQNGTFTAEWAAGINTKF